MNTKSPITKVGYQKLEKELSFLKNVKRPEVVKAIEIACSHGDLSENAEYDLAKEQQAFVERKIRNIENLLLNAEIIEIRNTNNSSISFGATVFLKEIGQDIKKVYTIVGKDEANIKENKISLLSPLAKSLIGKKAGDYISVLLPNQITQEYEIISVEYIT
jgi:transcription elongation factor GreA